MSMIDVSDSEIRSMSDEKLRSMKEGLREINHEGRYLNITNDIMGRIIDEQLRRQKGKKS